jgi:putative peptide zinc metalloprotease protein
MENTQELYKRIEIFEKESDNTYLLLFQNKTLSVGYLVKDILLLLQNDIFDTSTINKSLQKEHNLDINNEDIEKTVSYINKFVIKKNNSFFFKFGKLINPEFISFRFNFIFEKFIFYFSFVFSFILNLIISIIISYESIDNTNGRVIWFLLLLIVLFFHELGHSFSAKKFGINCKEIGIGLYLIFPVLYTNLGESWKLKKDKRIIINLSGIYFQLVLGLIIGLSAWFTNSAVLSSLFFTNLTIALLNLNPFFKLDGYWVVADLLNTGNLYKDSNNELRSLFSSKSNNKKNIKLLIYAVLRLIFIAFVIYLIINTTISLINKIYSSIPLSYHEYILIVLLLFYTFKFIKNGYSKRKTRVLS